MAGLVPATHVSARWIGDVLRPVPHPAHWNLTQALQAIAEIRPKRAFLTHMHVDMDYDTLCRTLPDHVCPAYDGLRFEFEA